jgi:CRP-like cAMP-binding protein
MADDELESLDVARALRACALFADFSDAELAAIGPLLDVRTVAAGVVIVQEGEPTSEIFVVLRGAVEVTKRAAGADVDHQLTILGAGATFGELAIADEAPRSATVRALEPTTLAGVDRARLVDASAGDPAIRARLLFNVARHVGRRLRDVSDLTVAALERELALARLRVAMATFLTYVIFVMVAYAFAMRLASDMVRSAADTTLVTVPIILMFTGPLYVMMRRSGQPMATYGLTWRGARSGAVDALRWSVPVLAMALAVKLVLVHTVDRLADAPVFQLGGFLDPEVPWADAWFTLGMSLAYVALVPLQEFMARGALQTPLQRFLVGRRATLLAVVIANALFTASHLYLSTVFALVAMLPGFLWGWLYARHGTLVAPIVSHALVGWWSLFVLGFDRLLA